MLPEPIRWSHATGKRVVPSPWQMTLIPPRCRNFISSRRSAFAISTSSPGRKLDKGTV